MPVAIALIVGIVVLATTLICLLWAVVFLLPFYAYVAAAVYNETRRTAERSMHDEAPTRRSCLCGRASAIVFAIIVAMIFSRWRHPLGYCDPPALLSGGHAPAALRLVVRQPDHIRSKIRPEHSRFEERRL